MRVERDVFEKGKRENCHMELVAEREKFAKLNAELDGMMEQVRHLHHVNEELVHRFCDY